MEDTFHLALVGVLFQDSEGRVEACVRTDVYRPFQAS